MKFANDNLILPFKDRIINTDKEIRIYRNLNKKGVWFSVVQGNKTVAHTNAICLRDVKFVVHEKGRQRVVKTKQKEFHAYIQGRYETSGAGTTAKNNDLPAHIKYDPFLYDTFICDNLTVNKIPVKSAGFVICNELGVRAININ